MYLLMYLLFRKIYQGFAFYYFWSVLLHKILIGFNKVFMGWQYQTKGKSLVTLKSWPGLLSWGIIFIFVWISVLYPLTFILFMWFNLINLTYIELTIKDETTETIPRLNCIFCPKNRLFIAYLLTWKRKKPVSSCRKSWI